MIKWFIVNVSASNTRKINEKKIEVVREVKTYLNSEILREPQNIHNFNLF